MWAHMTVTVSGRVFGVTFGRLGTFRQPTQSSYGLVIAQNRLPKTNQLVVAMRWWFSYGKNSLLIPLWVFFGPVGVGSAIAWRYWMLAKARQVTGRFAKCGYDLSGISPEAHCPECGALRLPGTSGL